MAAMGHIRYKRKQLKVNENLVPMRLQGDGGCANLVAIHNMLKINGCRKGDTIERSEQLIMRDLKEKLEARILSVKDIPPAEANGARNTLASIRTLFCLKPCLTSHLDFEKNGSRLLCELLDLHVLHAWVLDPQEKNYDTFIHFSHSDLTEYYMNEDNDHLDVCKRLLESSVTSYGLENLHEELSDSGPALLFRRDRLDVVCKRNGHLFIFVVDETICKQINGAVWMLLEEHEEQSIYFTDKFLPVRDQPHSEKAMKWYREFLEKLKKDNKPKEDKGEERKKSSQQRQSDDAGGSSIPSEATLERADAVSSHQGDVGDVVVSHQEGVKNSPQQAHSVAAESSESTTEILTTGKGAETVGSHQDDCEVVVSHQDSTLKKSPQQAHCADGAAESSKSTTGILTTGNEAEVKSEEDERARAAGNISGSQDGVPKGDASDFLKFLDEFKDNGCSKHYFKGVVAAFATQKPLFYVPYDFIMSFNEPLALKIEDNYSGICEDLKKAVDFYLSKNGVDSPDAILKILGLPEAKSVQPFVDFVESIVLHEYYSVFDECPQALPSYDSRRMGLGFLSAIVAKFKTSRCWDGKWTEANMKVKNGNKFMIDLNEDCELTADSGYRDLTRFCETVLNRLKIDGQFPPYFDELAEDHMLINDCFGDPEKWRRFLVLISYPIALKPPLVRASFICDIYIAGDAHSSGIPAQYRPLYSRKNCASWRLGVQNHELLLKVYNYPLDQKSTRYKYLIDHWSPTHCHVFKFSRHFIQHALQYTKGEDLTQKVEDISVLDIVLSRTISKAIAKSVTFLVLHCGVDGLFSSPWRHYVGSDYVDKLEDAIAGGVVEGLLHSVEQNVERSGYVYSEISLYSEPQHVSLISHDGDLIQLKKFLDGINIVCVHNGDYLQYGSVKLSKSACPATEECPARGVIVLEGPYSAEYDSLYDVLLAQDALTENLPPTL